MRDLSFMGTQRKKEKNLNTISLKYRQKQKFFTSSNLKVSYVSVEAVPCNIVKMCKIENNIETKRGKKLWHR